MSYQYPTDPEPSTNRDEITICKNAPCQNVVPPHHYPNAKPRKFCSTECNHRFHALAYEQRDSLKGALMAETSRGPRLNRRKPFTERKAKQRLQAHHRKCRMNNDDYCLASSDSYGQDRICLMKSVYYEDWIELYRLEKGYDYRPRVVTTEDGCWAADFEPPPRISVSKLPRVPVFE